MILSATRRLLRKSAGHGRRRALSFAANDFQAYGRQPPPGSGLVDLRSLVPPGWSERNPGAWDESLLVAAACVTPFEMNQYVVADKKSGQSVVIDSGGDDSEGIPEAIKTWLRDNGLDEEPTYLLQTHAHIDHIAGLAATKRAFPSAKIMLHPME